MEDSPRILLVDDDQTLLESMRRIHRKHYRLTLAVGGRQGIEVIESEEPFDVVVSDYQMPEMNGAQFLARVEELSPDSVRVMLTGNSDLGTAIEAVNQGHIFRFLQKPCPPRVFADCMSAAYEQSLLQRSEKDLLENTLRGCIEVLSDVLSLTNPSAFGRATRIQSYVRQLIPHVSMEDPWQVETAALLSQIGWVAIPGDLIEHIAEGRDLDDQQLEVVDRHPGVSARLLGKIPRMEAISGMIAHQRIRFEESKERVDLEPAVLRGAHILSACLGFDELISLGATPAKALASMRIERGAYDPEILSALEHVRSEEQGAQVRDVSLGEVHIGMLVDEDVLSRTGALVVAKGHRVTESLLERLRSYAQLRGIREPIRVKVPLDVQRRAA